MRVSKERVRSRFAQAASTYDHQAVIQLQVAQNLLALLKKHVLQPPERIMEIGCCTGLLTARLHQLYTEMATFYVNDLVPDFQNLVSRRLDHDPRLVFLPGDIESLDIPENLDLIVTSSTLHWLDDISSLFQKLNSSLAPGGTLCFSIYGAENLSQIREITGIGLDYYSIDELKDIVTNLFDMLSCDEERITLPFDDPLAILKHLRETGVNALNTSPWTRSKLDQFVRDYKARFSMNGQVELTYHPIYCIARKKS